MGLTIYYHLSTSLSDPAGVMKLVEALRSFALDLPLEWVGEVQELRGEEADEAIEPDRRWMKIVCSDFIAGQRIRPAHAIAFSTLPGQGCESAHFGFSSYPAFVDPGPGSGRKQKIATRLEGWRWSSFCKTQYASDPRYGGIENFLRCHLCVVRLLDFARKTGLVTVEARDDGEYWESRDRGRLIQKAAEWNETVAALVGVLRPHLEEHGEVEAPITHFPSFEHLEAKGEEKLSALWKSLGKGPPKRGRGRKKP